MPRIFDEDYQFNIGKAVKLCEGKDVTIIATGLMVNEAINAREILLNSGIEAAVLNIHTIKPIDREAVISAAKETGAIVTAEEHSIVGGLGGAVAEVVCENFPVPVLKVGVNDVFGRSGPGDEMLHIFGLDAANIVEKAKLAFRMK